MAKAYRVAKAYRGPQTERGVGELSALLAVTPKSHQSVPGESVPAGGPEGWGGEGSAVSVGCLESSWHSVSVVQVDR